jgi:mannan endo-1,4-beta-mannosidase
VVAWWTDPATIAVLQQFESRMIANIANEGGDTVDDAVWVSTYQSVVGTLRGAGLRLPLMIDAAGYGRNVDQLLRLAPQLVESDALHNVIFSWHVYNPGDAEAARIDASFAAARAAGLALAVGEFGPVSPGACHLSVPYAHVVDAAASAGIGWLAWSWDNFNGDCDLGSGSAFDMVSDGIHASTLVDGYARDVVVNLPGSIANTSAKTTWQTSGRCTP